MREAEEVNSSNNRVLSRHNKQFQSTGRSNESSPAETEFFLPISLLDSFRKRSSIDKQKVTAVVGKNVTLECFFNNTSDVMISWFRQQEDTSKLLTVGQQSFNSDSRVSVKFLSNETKWMLRVTNVQKNDTGYYDCQTSEYPSHFNRVYLEVTEPSAEMIDEKKNVLMEKHYKAGSTIKLSCRLKYIPIGSDVIWMHDGRILNYEKIRGGISIKTNRIGDEIESQIRLVGAKISDSGQYTCYVKETTKASANVYVVSDESSAAMQQTSASGKIIHLIRHIVNQSGCLILPYLLICHQISCIK